MVVEEVVHEPGKLLSKLICEFTVSNHGNTYKEVVAVTSTTRGTGHHLDMSTELTPLGMLDKGQDNILAREFGSVGEQLSTRGLSLGSILRSSNRKGFCLLSIGLCNGLSDIVSSNNQSTCHLCVLSIGEPRGPFTDPGGVKSASAHLSDKHPDEPESSRHASHEYVEQKVEESVASHFTKPP